MNVEDILDEMLETDCVLSDVRKSVKRVALSHDLGNYFLSLLLYSALIDSDKLHASQTEQPVRRQIPDLVTTYKQKVFGPPEGINILREQAYSEVVSVLKSLKKIPGVYTITLPTGLGKTFVGLNCALMLREKIRHILGGEPPRIIYSLPFLSIIDQNGAVIEDIFSKTDGEPTQDMVLKHHHLSDFSYSGVFEEELRADQAMLLVTSWYSEIILTTFHQLFHTLITNKNKSARKLHNLINSVIILDEVQAIPVRYWRVLEEMLTLLCDEYHCTVILMTATQPALFKGQAYELIKNPEHYFSEVDRRSYRFDLQEKSIPSFCEGRLSEALRGEEDVLVVANTITSSREIYDFIRRQYSGSIDGDGVYVGDGVELYYLNSLLLPKHRLKKLERIRSSKKRRIIVSTQLIEAGVDISVDILFRDLAPLDCIIQSGGRCNRHGTENTGLVEVIKLRDERRAFSDYIYDPILLQATVSILERYRGVNVPESAFSLKETGQYFEEVRKRIGDDESRELLEQLSHLNFNETRRFQLIEAVRNISFYVEADKKAGVGLEKMRSLLEEEEYSEKGGVRQLRRSLNEYLITVRYTEKREDLVVGLPPLGDLEDTYIVSQELLGGWYTNEYGLTFPTSPQADLRIL